MSVVATRPPILPIMRLILWIGQWLRAWRLHCIAQSITSIAREMNRGNRGNRENKRLPSAVTPPSRWPSCLQPFAFCCGAFTSQCLYSFCR